MREERVYGSGCDPVRMTCACSWETVRGRERKAQDFKRKGKVKALGKNEERSIWRYRVKASLYCRCFDSCRSWLFHAVVGLVYREKPESHIDINERVKRGECEVEWQTEITPNEIKHLNPICSNKSVSGFVFHFIFPTPDDSVFVPFKVRGAVIQNNKWK